ncbi:glycosyltransferase family 2 protein [Agaribacterium haliotis]|uniref:glycosyltransferase family 2 protein n=1 Tax=Agaribacterium haliotis TaxID=2013869 RepID=UPI000BB549EE|nr:glycosyltransferase family 2 protein [Agaribacterium haliotis]
MSDQVVSVVLPVYNVESYLEQCLDSVLDQSYRNYELICINDGSTDQSLALLEKYLPLFEGRMCIHSQANAGLAAARNKGLDLASGTFVYFLDSDDWIDRETLATCVRTISVESADLVVFNAEAFCELDDVEDIDLHSYQRNLPKSLYGRDGIFVDTLKRSYIAQSCCYMYRRSSFEALRFIPGILHEDHYFSTILFIESAKTAVLKDEFFKRRIRAGSITTQKKSLRHAEGYYITAKALHKRYQEKIYGATLKAPFRQYLNLLLQHGIKAEYQFYQQNNRSMPITRKAELIRMFAGLLDAKTTLLLCCAPLFYRVKSLLVSRNASAKKEALGGV